MKRMVSERRYCTGQWFDVVKEWEDVFCERLQTGMIQLHFNGLIKAWNRAVLYYIPFRISKKRWRLGFVGSAGSDRPFRMKNVIPIYVDFHPRVMEKVIRDTRKLPCWFVTSGELCKRIREKAPGANCFFLPLSVADQWVAPRHVEKTIDVIQIGRKNPLLHEWMLAYCEQHPETDYVYRNEEKPDTYTSTLRGDIGGIDSREDFMSALGRAKISLVSTPGMDHSSRRYDPSVDFFTPRFYESVAARCFLIGRYSENDESRQIGIQPLCRQVRSREELETAVTECLHMKVEEREAEYLAFLNQNCTSRRVEEVLRVLRERGFEVGKGESQRYYYGI